jgi:hypothetical protein
MALESGEESRSTALPGGDRGDAARPEWHLGNSRLAWRDHSGGPQSQAGSSPPEPSRDYELCYLAFLSRRERLGDKPLHRHVPTIAQSEGKL